MLTISAPSDAYPSVGARCFGCDKHTAASTRRPAKWCSRQCRDRWRYANGKIKTSQGRYPGEPCRLCSKPTIRPSKNRLGPSGLCMSCYQHSPKAGTTGPRAMATLHLRVSRARTIPQAVAHSGPVHHYRNCCGWMHPAMHDVMSHRHHMGVNRYMRNRYRERTELQLAYFLGTMSKAEQAKLPRSLYEVALKRREMLEAARLVGNWRTDGNQVSNDPS